VIAADPAGPPQSLWPPPVIPAIRAFGTFDAEGNYTPSHLIVAPNLGMSFADAIAGTLVELEDGQLVQGTVVKIDRDEVLLDIGYKSEGVILARELSIRNDVNPHDIVKLGEKVEALVLQKEDKEGRLLLSKKRAQYERAWGNIEKLKEADGTVEGLVIEVVKGGLVVDIGLRGFLPASFVELRRVRDLQAYVGERVKAKIIELDKNRNNVVLSRRAYLEEIGGIDGNRPNQGRSAHRQHSGGSTTGTPEEEPRRASRLFVDGTNLLREQTKLIGGDGGTLPAGQFVRLERIRAALATTFPNSVITVFFDASFRHRLAPEDLRRIEDDEGCRFAPQGVPCDEPLLQAVRATNGVAISNDAYDDWRAKFPLLREPGRLWGGLEDPPDGSWYFTARGEAPTAKQRRTRRFPTS
jgi:predicted RNA-binding protein with RPS1 domain